MHKLHKMPKGSSLSAVLPLLVPSDTIEDSHILAFGKYMI